MKVSMAKTAAKVPTATAPKAPAKAAVATKPPVATTKAPKTPRAAASTNGNGKHLVIVESPAKAKTINKYLGDDYVVKASMGHIRDLPSKGMGVDLKTFEPEYEVIEKK